MVIAQTSSARDSGDSALRKPDAESKTIGNAFVQNSRALLVGIANQAEGLASMAEADTTIVCEIPPTARRVSLQPLPGWNDRGLRRSCLPDYDPASLRPQPFSSLAGRAKTIARGGDQL